MMLRLTMLLLCSAIGACAHETKQHGAAYLGPCLLKFEKQSGGNWLVTVDRKPREGFAFDDLFAAITISFRESLSAACLLWAAPADFGHEKVTPCILTFSHTANLWSARLDPRSLADPAQGTIVIIAELH